MIVLLTVIRALAVTLGMVILIMALDGIFGFVPDSEEPRPLQWRVAHAAVLAIAGLALVVPYRRLSSAALRFAVATVLVLCTAWMGYQTGVGALAYFAGRASWHGIPVSICVLAVLAVNLYAFARLAPKQLPR